MLVEVLSLGVVPATEDGNVLKVLTRLSVVQTGGKDEETPADG